MGNEGWRKGREAAVSIQTASLGLDQGIVWLCPHLGTLWNLPERATPAATPADHLRSAEPQ